MTRNHDQMAGSVVGEKSMPKMVKKKKKRQKQLLKVGINQVGPASLSARLQEFQVIPVPAVGTFSVKMTYLRRGKE